jgi:hypothetical protein
MPNLFWYICLAVIGIVGSAYTLYKKRDAYKISTLLVFYLFTAGLTWIGEFGVLGLFDSYAYKIEVFEDPWAQNLLGHLILNTTLYPAIAVIMVAYSLGYGWIAFSAALFTFIEYLFVKHGLYEQHWWKYYMTTFAVIAFLSFEHKWFTKIKRGCKGLKRAVTFYFVAMVIVHVPAPILLLMTKQYYSISFIDNYFQDLYRSSIFIIFLFHMIECFFFVLFTCVLKKWYWKPLPVLISIAAQSIFAKMGILVMQNGWKLIYTLIIYEIFIVIYILAEKYTVRPDLK